MSFQQPTLDDLLQLINTNNTLTLKSTDITWSKPQVVAGSWREQATLKNTAARVTADPASAFQGSVTQLYDRLKLSDLASFAGFRVLGPATATAVHELLTSIAYTTGLRFTTDDLENLSITTENSKRYAVLSAKPTSLGWIGSLKTEVIPGGVQLDTVVTQPVLPGLLYPNPEAVPGTDTMGSVYLYGYDFTAYYPDINGLIPGPLALADATKMVAMLKAVDVSAGKTLWTTDPAATAWSLDGAVITRNGLNNTATLPTNPAYKYVLGIQPKSTLTSPKGVMYLHYNDPFNPDEF
jgi:hypothetical protein